MSRRKRGRGAGEIPGKRPRHSDAQARAQRNVNDYRRYDAIVREVLGDVVDEDTPLPQRDDFESVWAYIRAVEVWEEAVRADGPEAVS